MFPTEADENKHRTIGAGRQGRLPNLRRSFGRTGGLAVGEDGGERGVLVQRLGVEPRAFLLDCRLQLVEKGVSIKAGGDRWQILDYRYAGSAQEAAPTPKQAGVERHRKAGRSGVLIEFGDAEFINRRRIGRPARSLRKNEHLATRSQYLAGARADQGQRVAAR